MAETVRFNLRRALGGVAIFAMTCAGMATTAAAQGTKTIRGADYTPTIWVDPDGCKHWVVDGGLEGYMSPVLNVDGTPDCV